MSALGQKRTLRRVCVMSALPPKADIVQPGANVRFVPLTSDLRLDAPAKFASLFDEAGGGDIVS
jgi:hypothetical protein